MLLTARWNIDALDLVPLCCFAMLYTRRCGRLSVRRRPVPRVRQAAFYMGLLVIAVALCSPIDTIGETQLFWVHMLQHLLLGDIATLCLAFGLTGAVLGPLLRVGPRRVAEYVMQPAPALILWAANLYLWHIPFMYELALHHDAFHALEHAAFITGGLLVWGSVFEIVPGPVWFGAAAKAGFIVVVRLTEAVLANIFVWSAHPFYSTYIHAARPGGWTAAHDQNMAGIAMLLEGSIVTIVALVVLLWRAAEESERRQQLVELGIPAARATRAARYGRTAALVEAAERDLTGSGAKS